MKIEEIKKEFDIKISHAFGEDPRGFKIYCFECDDGVDKEGLWKWIETKLLLIKRDARMELEVEIGLQKFGQLMAEKEKIRREAVENYRATVMGGLISYFKSSDPVMAEKMQNVLNKLEDSQ